MKQKIGKDDSNIPLTKVKLTKVNKQLEGLDKEINEIQSELNNSRSFSADNLLKDMHPSSSKKQGRNLYQKSIQVMNQRAEDRINEDEDIDVVLQHKSKIKIKGYRPPSERVFDVNEKKNTLINAIKEEREKVIQEECTFKPEINVKSKEMKYDPSHLTKPKKKEQTQKIEPQPKKLNDGGIGIYSRQVQKNTFVQPAKEKGNVISPKSEKKLVDRLSKPREVITQNTENQNNNNDNNNNNNNKRQRKFATKEGTNRLVIQSIKRDIPEQEEEVQQCCFMNPKSKGLTKNKKRVDLFGEYLEAKERIRQRNEEVKEWKMITEQNENMNHEQQKFKKIDITKNPQVAGMDDYVERMKNRSTPNEIEPIPTNLPPIVIAKPFTFELREELKKQNYSKEVDGILKEIGDLLNKI